LILGILTDRRQLRRKAAVRRTISRNHSVIGLRARNRKDHAKVLLDRAFAKPSRCVRGRERARKTAIVGIVITTAIPKGGDGSESERG
jgi:hypothetical protein